MKFVLIPPGEFLMGSTAEEIAAGLKDAGEDKYWQERIQSEAPQHKVILTQPVYLGVNEVTQAEYEKVMGVNPSHFAPMGMGKEAVAGLETAKHPVEMVSWNDAAEFCTKLSNQEKLKPFYFRAGDTITPLDGTGYRLPSEAEWEFACRAGTTTKYWIGDNDEDLVQAGWFVGNSGGRTHAAGEPKANPFGLADIHGNVLEWVQDGWDATYYGQFQEKPSINPNSPFSTGSQRVIRGGSWYKTASRCRSSYRDAVVPTYLNHFIGFRAALTVDEVKGMQAKGNSAGAAIGSASKIPPDLTPPAPLGTWKAGTPAAWLTQDYRHDGPVMGGLIDTPRAIPGVKRWNVDTAWTRGEIREVRFSPDGKWVALGCTDGHVRILDATTMKLVSLLTGVGGQGGDMGLDWHPDSQQLAVCVAGQVRILSRDGQSSRALPISSGFYPTSVVWNHAGTRLAMGRGSGEFALEIRAADGTLVSQVSDEDRTFTQVCEPCWTADDRHVFCLGGKRCAKIDAETGQAIWTVDDLAPNFAGPLSLSSDGWLAVGDGGNVRLYDPERRLARTLATPGLATIAWHPDGKRLFAGLSLWDRDTGKQIVDTGFRAISAAWSPDGLRLLASQFAELREFTSTGESSGRLSGLDGNHVPISSLRWSPDGRRLAGRGGVFSPRERQILASDQGLSVSIQPPLFASMSVEWLPNSSATFAVGRERDNPTAALRLWAIQPDGVARTLWTPEKPLNSLSWSTCGVSPDGKFLAISLPGAIQILDPSGTPLQTIPTGGDAHPFPSWNPYTGELAILQENEPLRIADPTRNWDIRTAASPLRFTFNTSAPLPHWSPDGKWLAIERFGLFDTEGRPAPDNASKDQVATWRADSAEYVWAGGQQTLFDIHSADGSRKRSRIVNNGLVCAAWHPRGHLIATGSYASVLTAWRTFDLLPHWTMVLLPNDQSATFSGAGELLHPDPAAFDDLLVYTVEREDGSTVNLTPSQFTKFVAEADAPK
jgi:formylglycine-generating enzyme required for sulfatase activity/WD40 repeat protein